jgi:hypothetical protein
MKIAVGIIILVISICISYCIGYYTAVNDTVFMLSAFGAKNSIQTLKYLNEGKLDSIKSVHLINAEVNMAGVEDTFSLRGNITKIPQRFLLYHGVYSHSDESEKQIVESLKQQYIKIVNKPEAKPNKSRSSKPACEKE